MTQSPAAPPPMQRPPGRIRRWVYSRWLLAGVVVVLVPLTLATCSYLPQQSRTLIAFHQQERRGLDFLRPVLALLDQLVKERTGSGSNVQAAVAAVDAADARYGSRLDASARWRDWKAQRAQYRDGSRPTFEAYNTLTALLTGLIRHVTDASNLILDPDLDSYHVIVAVAVGQPMLLDQLGQAVELGSLEQLTGPQRDQLVVARAGMDISVQSIAGDLSTADAITSDPAIPAATLQASTSLSAAVAHTSGVLGDVLAGRRIPPDPAVVLQTTRALTMLSLERIDTLLTGRITVLRARVRNITRLVLVLATLLLILAVGLSRALRTVGHQTEELRHLALHDVLTGLPNRALILDRAQQALVRSRRAGTSVAMMFVDLDGFKAVNDTYGHAVGDRLLQAVSVRLALALRESDTIGRLGGDEFVVLATGGSDDPGCERVADRIQAALVAPFDLQGHPKIVLHTHASIGIAAGPRTTAAELLRDADVALYAAKAAGKNCHVLFDPAMQRAVQDRLELETDLRAATGTEQLFLVYQPVFDLAGEFVTGVEALLRWNHPTRGLVMPDDFIPVAEESGLIIGIGRAVLLQACRQARAWGELGHPLSVAVNVSGRQLDGSSDLLEDVRAALEQSALDPHLLTLEITETMLMRDVARSAQQVKDLKQVGVRVAIDDFGTGYCSMSYLQEFVVDILKIDRSFISGIGKSSRADALVHTFVQLGLALGIQTCAEGIEELAQLRHLQQGGCDVGQGYLLARPLGAEALIEFLAGDLLVPVGAIPSQLRA